VPGIVAFLIKNIIQQFFGLAQSTFGSAGLKIDDKTARHEHMITNRDQLPTRIQVLLVCAQFSSAGPFSTAYEGCTHSGKAY
jgi:hypothetical protein